MGTDSYSYEAQQASTRQQLAKACLKYMNANNLTQGQMVNILRISHNTLMNILSCKANPTLNITAKIIALTGCTLSPLNG